LANGGLTEWAVLPGVATLPGTRVASGRDLAGDIWVRPVAYEHEGKTAFWTFREDRFGTSSEKGKVNQSSKRNRLWVEAGRAQEAGVMDLREELHAYFQKSTLTLNHLGVIFGLEVGGSGKLWSGFGAGNESKEIGPSARNQEATT
jgi:hypothetical protein